MNRRLSVSPLLIVLLALLAGCSWTVTVGDAYTPTQTSDLRTVEPVTRVLLSQGEAESFTVWMPTDPSDLVYFMSEPGTRLVVSKGGEAIASSQTTGIFIAGESAFTPVRLTPSIVIEPLEPPDENTYACPGPCIALSPRYVTGFVTFTVRNTSSTTIVDVLVAQKEVGDVTEPANDAVDTVPLASSVDTATYAAIETLDDVDWFYAAADRAYEVVTPEQLDLTIRIYKTSPVRTYECNLDANSIYAFDLLADVEIEQGDAVRIEARFGDAASYFGGEYLIRPVAAPNVQVPGARCNLVQ